MLQQTRNKLEILEITDAQVYTKIFYRINKLFNDWVMHPTNWDVIHCEVIDFREIIISINNMDYSQDQ